MMRIVLLLAVLAASSLLLWALLSDPFAKPPESMVVTPLVAATLQPATQAGPSPAASLDRPVSEYAMSKADREQALRQQLADQLRAAQQQPGDLQALFAQLPRWCADQDCQALLAQVLAEYPDQEFADLLARIQARLPGYQAAMASLLMSTDTPPQQRYQALREVRQQTLGEDEAAAMFARQDRWADYQFGYAELLAGAAYLSPEQRLQALAALRQQHFADDYPALQQQEGAAGRFQRELQLLLVGVDDPQQQAEIARQLRQQHYGDAAGQWQQRDEQVAEQQRQMTLYQQQRQQLDEEMAHLQGSLPESEWQQRYQQRLQALRDAHFASDQEGR